jgi:hypothetical protein
MRVLVIPEDYPLDHYILEPIISAMMRYLGKPRVHVEICRNPILGGTGRALRWEHIQPIIERYQYNVDFFIHIVDRDGDSGRRKALDNLELKAKGILDVRRFFFSENAWQEIEAWVLAGHKIPKHWDWPSIRAEANCKEIYFEPFASKRGLSDEPGGGRKTLSREAASNYRRIRQLCREDVAALEEKVRKSLP